MLTRRRHALSVLLVAGALGIGWAVASTVAVGAYTPTPPVQSVTTSSTTSTTSTTLGGSTQAPQTGPAAGGGGASTSPAGAGAGNGSGVRPTGLATGDAGATGGATVVSGSSLPFTGSDVIGLLVIALALLIAGLLALRAGRRRRAA